MKTLTRQSYARRLERVITYLTNHLDGDVSLERLAEEACLSATHFHRIYHSVTRETVVQTVRRLRLHRAAVELISSMTSINRIAADAGYSSVQAFSKAFRLAYAVPPSSYRALQFRKPNSSALATQFLLQPKEKFVMHQIKIESFEPCRVAAMQHDGDYMEVGNTFDKLMIWATGQGLDVDTARSFGIYYDDPAAVEKHKLRSDACIEIPADFVPPAECRALQMPAVRCATLMHIGPYSDLEKSYQQLYGIWLPASGEEPNEHPPFEEYLNDPRVVPPSELQTAIRLPLR